MANEQLSYTGVGNIEARPISTERTERLDSARGVLGAMLPTIRPVEIPYHPSGRW